MAYLVLVRHGLSEYNKKGLWTGHDDPDLAEEGLSDAHVAAKTLRGIEFDAAFSSNLKRHTATLSTILSDLDQSNISQSKTNALSERNYGIYTAKNKWEIKEKIGEIEFKKLRRGWDYPIPEGESLKDVYQRVTEYYIREIQPLLKDNRNVIISSSGNVLRSLVKFLENISEEGIADVEIATGEVIVYKIENNNLVSKEIRNKKENIY